MFEDLEGRIARDTVTFLMKVQVAVEAERTAGAGDLSELPLARPGDGGSRRAPAMAPTRGLRTASAPALAPATRAKVGRNDPCPCGSGKKYKKCCGA
jgi:preprotein translocase subunit SecA